MQITALIGASYENSLALDAKINFSWRYKGLVTVNVAYHNKTHNDASMLQRSVEASFMLNNSFNIFAAYERVDDMQHRTRLGLDIHF